jgi:antitoxin component YwqK of YwqJK toxin-antitoxin module
MLLVAVTTCEKFADYLSISLPYNRRHFDAYIVVTTEDQEAVKALCLANDVIPAITNRFYVDGSRFNKGKGINEGLKLAPTDAWVVLLDSDIVLPSTFRDQVLSQDLDDQAMYGCVRQMCPSYSAWRRFQVSNTTAWDWNDYAVSYFSPQLNHVVYDDPSVSNRLAPLGFFQLFSINTARRLFDPIYPEDCPAAAESDVKFALQWKQCELLTSFEVVHLPSPGGKGMNWRGRVSKPFTMVEPEPLAFIPDRAAEQAPKAFAMYEGARNCLFENGNPAEQGSYHEGLAEGEWTEWHENGSIASRGSYEAGKPDGKWTRFSADGSHIEEYTFKLGRLDGPFSVRLGTGQTILTGQFISGLIEGELIEWYPGGQRAATVIYESGKKSGRACVWFPNGRVALSIHYENDKRHGAYQFFYQNGLLAVEGSHHLGRPHGQIAIWREDGQPAFDCQSHHGRMIPCGALGMLGEMLRQVRQGRQVYVAISGLNGSAAGHKPWQQASGTRATPTECGLESHADSQTIDALRESANPRGLEASPYVNFWLAIPINTAEILARHRLMIGPKPLLAAPKDRMCGAHRSASDVSSDSLARVTVCAIQF